MRRNSFCDNHIIVIYLLKQFDLGRVLKKINKDTYHVEVIEIPKKNFSQFIEEESKKNPVKIGFFIF